MYLLCSKVLRTVLGESCIHTRVIFQYTRHTKKNFREFVPKLTMIDVFRTLLGFELFPTVLLLWTVLKLSIWTINNPMICSDYQTKPLSLLWSILTIILNRHYSSELIRLSIFTLISPLNWPDYQSKPSLLLWSLNCLDFQSKHLLLTISWIKSLQWQPKFNIVLNYQLRPLPWRRQTFGKVGLSRQLLDTLTTILRWVSFKILNWEISVIFTCRASFSSLQKIDNKIKRKA